MQLQDGNADRVKQIATTLKQIDWLRTKASREPSTICELTQTHVHFINRFVKPAMSPLQPRMHEIGQQHEDQTQLFYGGKRRHDIW